MLGFIASLIMAFSIPIASDRNNFKDADHINEEGTMYKTVNLKNRDKQHLGRKNFLKQVEGKTVLLLIHGYNNDYKEAIEFCKNCYQLSNPSYDQILGYLWPGGDEGKEYLAARRRVIKDIDLRLLGLVSQMKPLAANIDIYAHSMGCRLALEMLDLAPGKLVRNLFLAAPAVDNESLEKNERYYDATQNCQAVTVFHSKHDKVLKRFYSLGLDRALGLRGPENPHKLPDNVSVIDSSHAINKHGDYDESPFIFKTIAQIVTPIPTPDD